MAGWRWRREEWTGGYLSRNYPAFKQGEKWLKKKKQTQNTRMTKKTWHLCHQNHRRKGKRVWYWKIFEDILALQVWQKTVSQGEGMTRKVMSKRLCGWGTVKKTVERHWSCHWAPVSLAIHREPGRQHLLSWWRRLHHQWNSLAKTIFFNAAWPDQAHT